MATTTMLNLPVVTGLVGDESVWVVQAGTDKRTTVAALFNTIIGSMIFDNRSVAEAFDPTADNIPGFIALAGYTNPGDTPLTLYKAAAVEPTHAGKLQSANGSWWELAEPVISPEMLGAVGDGTTDDTTALSNWLAVCIAQGVRGQAVHEKTYKITSGLRNHDNDLDVDFAGSTVKLVTASNDITALTIDYFTLYGTATLASDSAKDALSFVVTNASLFVVGRYVEIFVNIGPVGQSFISKVIGVSGTTISIDRALPFNLTTLNVFSLTVYQPLSGVNVRNLVLEGASATGARNNGIVALRLDETCSLENIVVKNFSATSSTSGLYMQNLYGTHLINFTTMNSGSANVDAIQLFHCTGCVLDTPTSSFDAGFGIGFGACSYLRIINPSVAGSNGRAFKFGGTVASYVIGGTLSNDRLSGVGLAVTWASQNNIFIGLQITGAAGNQSNGIWTASDDSSNNLFIGCQVSGYGAPIATFSGDTGNRFIDCNVDNVNLVFSNGDATFEGLNGYALFSARDDATAGPVQSLLRRSPSPASGDNLAITKYKGLTHTAVISDFATTYCNAEDITNGAMFGQWIVTVQKGGVDTGILAVTSSGIQPFTDNLFSNGTAAKRWTTVYATTGAINTSDAREKTVSEDYLPQSAYDAILSVPCRWYRWNSDLEKLGEDAPYFYGPFAQDVWAALTEVGVNPEKLGMCVYDSSADIYSLRPDQFERVRAEAQRRQIAATSRQN